MNLPTTFFGWVAFITEKYGVAFLKGAGTSVYLAVLGTLLGCIIGFLAGTVRTVPLTREDNLFKRVGMNVVWAIIRFYVWIFRGTPMMVQLLIWAFVIFASSRNRTLIGAFGIGINSGAYVAEIVRGGLMSVDIGQSEAGRSLGLGYLDTMRFIVVPQAFKNILPALGNEFITLFKDTSLVSAIGGAELIYYAKAVGSKTFEVMYPYIGIAIMYLAVVMLLTWLQGKLERRLRQSDRR